MVGIITYGVYIPRFRIKVEEIARVWGANPDDIRGGLGVHSKSVPDLDEDTATIAVEAARNSLRRRAIDPVDIGAVYVGPSRTPTQ
jgi:hydroxymethylglutaryl-CoA synthase